MAAKPKGMVDLGKSYKSMMAEKSTPEKDPISYPSIHLQDVKEFHDLPDGEFYFIAKAEVVSHSDSTSKDGEDHCSCEIEIRSMKPLDKEDVPESAGTLEDELDSIAEKKSQATDPEEDTDSEE